MKRRQPCWENWGPEQVERVLHSAVIGRIGCEDEGDVYVVPITYAYDGRYVYGHSGNGRKLKMMRAHPRVCFEVEEMDNLSNWRSVIAWGTFEELKGPAAQAGMEVLLKRLAPLMASETSQPTHGMARAGHQQDTAGHSAALFRIDLEKKTGRFEKR